MEKTLSMFCPGHLRDPGTRRSIVYASFSSNSQKAVGNPRLAKHRAHPRPPLACREGAFTNTHRPRA
jgi:hypothetical protein